MYFRYLKFKYWYRYEGRQVRRGLAGVFAVVALSLVVGWMLFVPMADWLATHDVGHVTGSTRASSLQTARDAARGRVLTFGAGLFAAGALVYTARSFGLTREGQVTDRYTKAIDQLGSDKLDVRIGGIYALERIAYDSARDHPPVIEVLVAFIREHSHEQWPLSERQLDASSPRIRPDVQAALHVVGRRNPRNDRQLTALTGARLIGADLMDRNFRGADFTGADLTGANLHGADLTNAKFIGAVMPGADLQWALLAHADLTHADLTDAVLTNAHLTDIDLTDANLTGSNLIDARFVGEFWGAKLVRANLTRANLTRARFVRARGFLAPSTGVNLTDANLTSANLRDANLTGADLTDADLTDANLTGVKLPSGAPCPNGWVRNSSTGLLERGSEELGNGS